MKQVSGEGRTVLFVSHNMAAVKSLCNNGIVLNNGQLNFIGSIQNAVEEYSQLGQRSLNINLLNRKDRIGTGLIKFSDVKFYDLKNKELNTLSTGMSALIKFYFNNNIKSGTEKKIRFDVGVFDETENRIFQLSTFYQKEEFLINSEKTHFTIYIPKLNLLEGNYILTIYSKIDEDEADWIQNAFSFYVDSGDYYGFGRVMPKGFGKIATEHLIELK
jgi:lipopolysaccharide transport system ATP-binding protein